MLSVIHPTIYKSGFIDEILQLTFRINGKIVARITIDDNLFDYLDISTYDDTLYIRMKSGLGLC